MAATFVIFWQWLPSKMADMFKLKTEPNLVVSGFSAITYEQKYLKVINKNAEWMHEECLAVEWWQPLLLQYLVIASIQDGWDLFKLKIDPNLVASSFYSESPCWSIAIIVVYLINNIFVQIPKILDQK